MLIRQIADEQRPADRQQNGGNILDDRHAGRKIRGIYAQQCHKLPEQLFHHLVPHRCQPFKQRFDKFFENRMTSSCNNGRIIV